MEVYPGGARVSSFTLGSQTQDFTAWKRRGSFKLYRVLTKSTVSLLSPPPPKIQIPAIIISQAPLTKLTLFATPWCFLETQLHPMFKHIWPVSVAFPNMHSVLDHATDFSKTTQRFIKPKQARIWLQRALYLILISPKYSTRGSQPHFVTWPLSGTSEPSIRAFH